MSRQARVTDLNGIYHIVIHESKSKPLFPSESDKEMMMEKIRESQIKYQFKIYAYCLMDTHAHFIIDSNGEEISTIMKSIGLRYVKYYNPKYDTNGPLLKERFFSELINTDEYLLKASLYIHANPKDIFGYSEMPETYRFSSMRCYLGNEDEFGILDTDFILSILSINSRYAVESYVKLFKHTLIQKVSHFKELDLSTTLTIDNRKIEIKINDKKFGITRKILKRNFDVEQIINFVEKETGITRSSFLTKADHGVKTPKALFILLTGIYTEKTTYEIGHILEDMSIEEVNALSNEGIHLVLHEDKYKNIIEKFYSENK